jgi:acetyl-CoA carboxylase carboxyl transferase subunit alpha
MQHFLDFERPIVDLEAKIAELRRLTPENSIDIEDELRRLEAKCRKLTQEIFSDLTAWQVTQLARHPLRPYTLDYIGSLFTEFVELHGDRMYADDQAVVAGLGRLSGRGVGIIGHQKGRDTNEKISRNFGMPRPEGFRKAQRIMKLAQRYGLPLVTFIDTPGAYPGIEAEERGQSAAIASSISLMADLKVPIISVVIGEGGSGGALAVAVCDRLLMLEYSTYSVISPEGCASILWKDADRALSAAEAMKMTSDELKNRQFIDEVVAEPLGGAHRNFKAITESVREAVERHLEELCSFDPVDLLDRRYRRIQSFGRYSEKS